MIIFNFGMDTGRKIDAYDSKNLMMSRISRSLDSVHLGYMYLGANGVVGSHQAAVPQLLIVVEGEGIVKGKENVEHRIVAGFSAFWEAGEWHETRTEQGLSAMVIESGSLNPGVIQ